MCGEPVRFDGMIENPLPFTGSEPPRRPQLLTANTLLTVIRSMVMMMRAALSPRMLTAVRPGWLGGISDRIASFVNDPDLLVACAVAAVGLAASFGFFLALTTESATLLAQLAD
jgi:hypothetical protein